MSLYKFQIFKSIGCIAIIFRQSSRISKSRLFEIKSFGSQSRLFAISTHDIPMSRRGPNKESRYANCQFQNSALVLIAGYFMPEFWKHYFKKWEDQLYNVYYIGCH